MYIQTHTYIPPLLLLLPLLQNYDLDQMNRRRRASSTCDTRETEETRRGISTILAEITMDTRVGRVPFNCFALQRYGTGGDISWASLKEVHTPVYMNDSYPSRQTSQTAQPVVMLVGEGEEERAAKCRATPLTFHPTSNQGNTQPVQRSTAASTKRKRETMQ